MVLKGNSGGMTAPLLSALHALLGRLGPERDRQFSLPLGQTRIHFRVCSSSLILALFDGAY